jgi:hypothetical protein
MWVARVLSGKILLPKEEEMMESVQNIYHEMEKNGLPKSCALSLRPLQVNKLNPILFIFWYLIITFSVSLMDIITSTSSVVCSYIYVKKIELKMNSRTTLTHYGFYD